MARTRYQGRVEVRFRQLPAAALRAVFRDGYHLADFRRDLLAGLVVGVVALPLSMALAIAVGAPPQHGLYTAIVGGFVVALLGGSRTQVTGPTAAFVVILAPIYSRFGLAGLLMAGLLGGIMLAGMGFFRLGKFIEFIPHPVTTGFTAGIGTVIATMQLKDLLGLQLQKMPEHFLERLGAMFEARGTASWYELFIGLCTLVPLIFLPRFTKLIPPAVVALPLGAVLGLLLERWIPNLEIATVARRFHAVVNGHEVAGIPRSPPLPFLPWQLPGPSGQPFNFSFATLRLLLPGAFAIAMLGAIESLLSAVVSDGMARTRHDPDAELLALGVGNILCPFFGGIPATGAIARTATGIRSGARSPIAAMTHSVFVLLAVLVLAPLVGYLPMASLAALLVLVAWNMADVKLFAQILRVAPRSDVAVLLTCFTLTVVFDMVIAVTVGILLAAMLFMKRMSEITESKLTEEQHPGVSGKLPNGVLIYEIAGPLFFGAAERAMNALRSAVGRRASVMILDLEQVPVLDATGLVALETSVKQLNAAGCLTIIAGLKPRTKALVTRGIPEVRGKVMICGNLAAALEEAKAHVAKASPSTVHVAATV